MGIALLVPLSFAMLQALTDCAEVKPVIRTVFDVAVELCEASGAARVRADKQGISVREWCSVAKNVQPFVDAVLSAQQRAELSLEQKSSCQPTDAGDE